MNKKRRLSLILAALVAVTLVAVHAWAQSGSVRGRVLDEAGEPLEGVEILIERDCALIGLHISGEIANSGRKFLRQHSPNRPTELIVSVEPTLVVRIGCESSQVCLQLEMSSVALLVEINLSGVFIDLSFGHGAWLFSAKTSE